MRELSPEQKARIIKRVEDDKKRPAGELVYVGVIDSGLDLAHPLLIDQIAYTVENGQIVGAGVDLYGRGAFASHVLVEPQLFAFGAKSVKKGIISGPPDRPLDLIMQTNREFAKAVVAGIKADPLLAQSLFARLTEDLILMPTFDDFVLNKADLIESYKNTAPDRLWNEAKLASTSLNPAETRIKANIEGGWWIHPEVVDLLVKARFDRFEHFDRFLDVVGTAFDHVNKSMHYKKNFENLRSYISAHQEEGKPVDRSDVLEVLNQAIGFHVWGPEGVDPIDSLIASFRMSSATRGLSIEEAIQVSADRLEKELIRVRKHAIPAEQKQIDKALKQIPNARAVGAWIHQIEKDPVQRQKLKSLYRKYRYRTKHPFLNRDTATNSHHTHVAGLIAKQDPRIRIVPIRVLTQGTTISERRLDDMIDSFVAHLDRWMQSEIGKGVSRQISREYGGYQIQPSSLRNGLKRYLRKNKTNAQFVHQTLEAVAAAGKLGLPLVNVSLGATFEKEFKKSDRLNSFIEDHFAELARFLIGEEVTQKAPNTVFGIATGNDNAWADGMTRTLFPVGFVSLRAAKVTQTEGGPVSPNNALRNVIAVGSTNEFGYLTSFTNLLIANGKSQQLFSDGEEEASAVPAKDPSLQDTVTLKPFFNLTLIRGVLNNIKARMKEEGISDPDSASSVGDELSVEDLFTDSALDGIQPLLTMVMHLNHPIEIAKQSGTSMATPNLIGQLAEALAKGKVQRSSNPVIAGIGSTKVARPSADDVVNYAVRFATSNDFGTALPIRTLVAELEKWRPSQNEKKSKAALNAILKAGSGATARGAVGCSSGFRAVN